MNIPKSSSEMTAKVSPKTSNANSKGEESSVLKENRMKAKLPLKINAFDAGLAVVVLLLITTTVLLSGGGRWILKQRAQQQQSKLVQAGVSSDCPPCEQARLDALAATEAIARANTIEVETISDQQQVNQSAGTDTDE
jgi:hypothetical protein